MTVKKEVVFMAVGKAIKVKQVEEMNQSRPYGALEVYVEVEEVTQTYSDIDGEEVSHGLDSVIRTRLAEIDEGGLITAGFMEEPERTVVYLTSEGLAQYNFNVT